MASNPHIGALRASSVAVACMGFCAWAAAACTRTEPGGGVEASPRSTVAVSDPAPDAAAVWSIAELESHRELQSGERVWLVGYAVEVYVQPCKCLPEAACAPCAAYVMVGDTPSAPARKVVMINLPGDVGLVQGARYEFSTFWDAWDPEPTLTAFARLSYKSHRRLE